MSSRRGGASQQPAPAETSNGPGLTRSQIRVLADFAWAASAISVQGTLQDVLDRLALAALNTLKARACAVVLAPPTERSAGMFGAAGFPAGHFERLVKANTRHAPLVAARAASSHRQLARRIDDLVGRDSRFVPLAPMARDAGWATIVASPLGRGRLVSGVLTAWYPEEARPSTAGLTLISSIAEYVGIAVSGARHLAEVERNAVNEERARLRRDLHDSLSHLLFSLRLHARALHRSLEDTGPASQMATPASMKELQSVIEKIVQEIRELALNSPQQVHNVDFSEAVSEVAAEFAKREGVSIRVAAVPHATPLLARPASDQILRILREAIGNSINHGRPASIGIELSTDEGATEFIIKVTDDGIGFDPTCVQPGHLGLVNMRTRARELGGELSIESDVAGSRVRLSVPLSERNLQRPD